MRMERRHTQTQIYFSAGDCYDYSFGTPVAGCSFRRWTLGAAAAAATRLQGWQGGKQGGRFNPPRIQHRGFSTADPRHLGNADGCPPGRGRSRRSIE